MADFKPMTPDGDFADEAVSALQKTIRRGLPREAIYWASQIEGMGWHEYLWKRLLIICHEDIGIAGVTVLPYVETCRQHYYWFMEQGLFENLPLINAVTAMAHAPKCRAAVSYHVLTYQEGADGAVDRFAVPDYARDMHTAAGRKLGRNIKHFQEEGDHLENERIELDPYKDEAMAKGLASKDSARYRIFIEKQKERQKKKAGTKKQPTGDLFGMLADDDNDAPQQRGMGDYFNK